MHIQIENFHNISSLVYDIEDSKINFLYGVSGSGKSSIVKGITQSIVEEVDTTVGCDSNEKATVLIDGKEGPLMSTVTFDEKRQSVLFSRVPEKGLYDIFIGDEEQLEAVRAKYQMAVASLRAKIGNLLRLKNEAEALIKTLGKTNRKGHFTPASKLGKARSAYQESSAAVRGYIEQRGMDVAAWIKQGFTVDASYGEGICPFCRRSLEGSSDQDALAELCDLSVNDLKPLFDSPERLAALGQDPIDLSSDEGVKRAEELVGALPSVSQEVDRIVGYCNAGSDYGDVRAMSVELLTPSPAILTFMPELREVMSEVNARAAEVKGLLAEMKTTFDKLVKTGCRGLNRKLVKFGIPYRFELSTANRDEKTASYRLVHANASDSTDMHESLSFGERNLITLILFLQDDESEVMLIDDPASSYDDFRRTQIFKAIMEVQGKTLLVVSHDQAFVRRAVRCREHRHERIGKVDMLCNRSGEASVEPITRDSFGYFEDMIRNRIGSSSTYFQQMLNVRLLCEVRDIDASDKNLWGYASAILHRASRDEVQKLLEDRGESEENILERLANLVGERCADQMIPIPDAIDYSTVGFSEFECLIAKREDISRPGGGSELPKGITKELAMDLLNDLVHMNDAMMDCIDPYRYPVWSPILFSLLES
ncbi:AAA family ATPase [Enorma phocaeensis]|uniref:AAA family ATPase n=1 Tax=Enorma phocaeensis TaxID=1871019 RepID=A0A921LTW0_9ACTN|nr:AAA family ATPase [Enorma phocaeensis]HJG37741.1 AAA family ATPase [Enorma phocaeensis]